MQYFKIIFFFILLGLQAEAFGQDISLYAQFNGRNDYVALGNTMNLGENGPGTICAISTASSASLNLLPSQNILAAYLYWAGSGTGDFDVSLNGIDISAERTFSDSLDPSRVFFAAFADVTDIINSQQNGLYTLFNLDLTSVINPYCPTGTNFAGWAITVIFQDDALPLNQVNIYDGLQSVPNELTIVLDNLNVLDNQDAKIGFIAWEGDSSLAVNEQLLINGNILQSLPLNPANNAFNGTNSFTGQSNLYNMDIDYYNIQNNINIGDTQATIQLTSGQDYVMVNNIITVLNSQLPDATIVLDNYFLSCGNRIIDLEYTVFNTNSTDPLPANTPIAFYADGQLIGQSATQNQLAISDSEPGTISLDIPIGIPNDFQLNLSVDDTGSGDGIIVEIVESNNIYSESINLIPLPESFDFPAISACDIGFNRATYNLLNTISIIENNIYLDFSFYQSLEDLEQMTNAILIPESYDSSTTPEIIYLRAATTFCYDIFKFDLLTENCPPHIPQGFSPNSDGFNDHFNIQGLYSIFENHELNIFNRYGTLIFQGNDDLKWFGEANRGIGKGKLVPSGTYYYVLHLRDPNYTPLTGWVYLNR